MDVLSLIKHTVEIGWDLGPSTGVLALGLTSLWATEYKVTLRD